MTQTTPPREMIARIVDPKAWTFADRHSSDERMAAEIRHEVVASQRMADAILTALASGSGDHAELARLAEAAGLLEDLSSWFTVHPGRGRAWIVPSGDLGADDAVNAARTFLSKEAERG